MVQVGDSVKIVPEEKVPADGTVVQGSSAVDESDVTEELFPVTKKIRDAVIGRTINGLCTFDMVVTRAGKDTALAQIVKLVEDAQASKAPIQGFIDRVAGVFAPTVLSLTAITFVVWMVVCHIGDDSSLPAIFRHLAPQNSPSVFDFAFPSSPLLVLVPSDLYQRDLRSYPGSLHTPPFSSRRL